MIYTTTKEIVLIINFVTFSQRFRLKEFGLSSQRKALDVACNLLDLEKNQLIKDLSDGYSTQSTTANRFWVILITISIITFTGKPDPKTSLIDLPFALGSVSLTDFYSAMIILSCVVTIAFTSAMIQALRTRELLQVVIDSMNNSELINHKVHFQDLIDSTLKPTFNKIGPISKFILGKGQFLTSKPKRFLKFLSDVFYIILKFTSFIFIYIIPFFSIKKAWTLLNSDPSDSIFQIPTAITASLIMLTAVVMFILLIGDVRYIIKVLKSKKK